MTHIRPWMSFKFDQIRPRTTELAPLERLKIDVATFSRLLLIKSMFNLLLMRKCMISNDVCNFYYLIMVFPGYLLFHLIVGKLFSLQNLALSLSLNVLQKC